MIQKIRHALRDKDFSELIRGGGISFFLRIGGLLLGAFLMWVIAYLFQEDGLGRYVLAIIVLRAFTIIAKLGMDISSLRFIASFASKNKWISIFKFRKKTILILLISSFHFHSL